MKVLVKEQGKEVMYIQTHDLITLEKKGIQLPFSKEKVSNILNNLSNYNPKELIPFADPREVNLLKAYDFIYSYKDLKPHNEEELQIRIDNLKKTIKGVNKRLEDQEEYNRSYFCIRVQKTCIHSFTS